MLKRLGDLIKYRGLKKQYKYLSASIKSTQTELRSIDQSIPYEGPSMEPQMDEESGINTQHGESTAWDEDEPNVHISPLLPVFLKSLKDQGKCG